VAELGVVLQVTRALTVGTAPRNAWVDAETAKDPVTGTPYIPASTLRGAWRMAACYAAPSLGMTCCGEKRPERIEQAHRLLAQSGASLPRVEGKPVCHVCALFGKPGLEGAVYFGDARPLNGLALLSIRPGVEIDDYTGTVSRNKLYHVETVELGSIFTFTIELDEERLEAHSMSLPDALLLLAAATELVEAIGVARGSARAHIWMIRHGDATYTSPENAAAALGGNRRSQLVRLLRRTWLPARLTVP